MKIDHLRRLALGALLLAAAACTDAADLDDTSSINITARRAWLPGERDSTVAAVIAANEWVFPGVGNVSEYADQMLPQDSVTVMVPNPNYVPAPSMMDGRLSASVRAAQWNTGWNIYGIDVWMINNVQVPPDTIRWVGVFWWNPAESNWKGWVIAASRNPTVAQTSINTTAFNAAFAKTGASAGEARFSSGTYWEGNGPGVAPNNTIVITAAAYGAAPTLTTGPFLGGTMANGSMNGRLRQIPITRVSGPTGPVTQTVDLNFSGAAIPAVQIICRFRTPCTTNVP